MTPAASATLAPTSRRILALHCPAVSADRWRRTAGVALPDDAPLVLTESWRGALRIAAVDPAAAALGLAAGMTLADARARVPELHAANHDEAADRRWLDRLAGLCDRYTPTVAIDGSDTILLDIAGCVHLFGDEVALAADAAARLEAAGAWARPFAASTPEAAAALARFAPLGADEAVLPTLPVAALRLDPAAEVALGRAGLKTVGDLASRPTAPLTARFGALATAALDRLLGRADSRLVPRRILPALVFSRRLAEPILQVEAALAIVARLAAKARTALAERDGGGRRFVVRFCRTDDAVRDLSVETGRPTRDPAVVMRLLRERIDALADPVDPGFGFDLVHLWVATVEPLAVSQTELGGGRSEDDTLAMLIDRLSARVGAERFCRFMPRDSHVPEQAAWAIPPADTQALASWPAPEPGEPPLRPLHLFDPPQPIVVTAAAFPDGPPRQFRWRGSRYEVIRYEGPERIGAPWWRRPDNGGLTRDYYRIEDACGRRFWLFRHGLYREAGEPRWYLHGVFA